jgi:hypothetical protein
MTIDLYGVGDALEGEEKLVERLQRALDWKLRAKAKGKQEIEEASNDLEEGLPEEAPKSNSPS